MAGGEEAVGMSAVQSTGKTNAPNRNSAQQPLLTEGCMMELRIPAMIADVQAADRGSQADVPGS